MTDHAVPIVGQVIKVLGYVVLPLVQCQCGSDAIQLTGQLSGTQWTAVPVSCPKCQNLYQIHGLESDARGLLKFQIAMGRPANA